MNLINLHPTDVLFFRDGRPMGGASSGNGAAWPLPHTINAAFHAALHRAKIEGVHAHKTASTQRAKKQNQQEGAREQLFGSLFTCGPFPVSPSNEWLFPRPADAQNPESTCPTLLPSSEASRSSLPSDLSPVLNQEPPTKNTPGAWFTAAQWEAYLGDDNDNTPSKFFSDGDFSDTEHQIGIAIDPDSGSTEDGKFYSAQYLRLKSGWRLGALAEAWDKINGDASNKRDLIGELIDAENHLIVGGQQRICTASCVPDESLPLPQAPSVSGTRVKWTLLTPAIFPKIGDHTGGWLPSWIHAKSLQVQLLDGPGKNKAARMNVAEGKPIRAKLVSAVVDRSVVVTGYASGNEVGAKSTHLAVPAGSVYYFEAEDEEQASKLAAVLNWHGSSAGASASIQNRRSTLFGEKGFGLGLCSTWKPIYNNHQN